MNQTNALQTMPVDVVATPPSNDPLAMGLDPPNDTRAGKKCNWCGDMIHSTDGHVEETDCHECAELFSLLGELVNKIRAKRSFESILIGTADKKTRYEIIDCEQIEVKNCLGCFNSCTCEGPARDGPDH